MFVCQCCDCSVYMFVSVVIVVLHVCQCCDCSVTCLFVNFVIVVFTCLFVSVVIVVFTCLLVL